MSLADQNINFDQIIQNYQSQLMNFLAFREQIYDWTLDTDQNLFNQVNQLTEYIFQTEKNIGQSIAITRASFNESSTILNNNFNHYLRLSENKFTQNKIAEAKQTPKQISKQEANVPEQKSKMDIYKQALNITLKNLQIKQEEKETDNVSISELSLSQAIFKNARLPPYFGSKQFRAQKFLSLFFDEDQGSQILSKKQIQNLNNQPLSKPSQNISSSTTFNANNGYLPPPPSLQSLNLGSNIFSGGMNPSLLSPPPLNLPPPPLNLPPPPLNLPPPPLNLPPPPPLNPQQSLPLNLPSPPPLNLTQPPLISNIPHQDSFIQIDDKDQNKQLLQSILNSSRNFKDKFDDSQKKQDSFIQSSTQNLPAASIPKTVQNKPLTLQQELALKLKYGKDYKPSAKTIEAKTESYPQVNKKVEIQPLGRQGNTKQSKKIDQIIEGASKNTKKASFQQTKHSYADEEEEQQENALFSSGKRKPTINTNANTNQNSKFEISKNEADIIMSKNKFNDDMLFKKKSAFSKESVLATKTQQKTQQKVQKKPNRASAIFDQDSDEQTDFTFKKKTSKKVQDKKKEEPIIQKQIKTKPLISDQKSPKTEELTNKAPQQTKKKTINKLFGGDSDEQQDIFQKKKLKQKKQTEALTKNTQKQIQKIQAKQSLKRQGEIAKQNKINSEKQKIPTKTNSLFENDEETDLSLKKKKKTPTKQNKIQTNKKKSSLFDQDQQDDSFALKAKKNQTKQIKNQKSPVQKPNPKDNQSPTKVIQKEETQASLEIRRKKNKPRKKSNDLFDQQQKDNKNLSSSTNILKIQEKSTEFLNNQEQKQPHELSQSNEKSEKDLKIQKIAKMNMAGMHQMGFGSLIPKGMIITKPSQAKKIQQQALEREKQQKQRLQKIQQEEKLKINQQKLRLQAQQLAERQKQNQEQIKRKKQIQEEQKESIRKAEELRVIQLQRENQREKKRILDQNNEKERLRILQEIQKQKIVQQENRKNFQQEQKRKAQKQQLIRAEQEKQRRYIQEQEKRNLQVKKRKAQQEQNKRIEQEKNALIEVQRGKNQEENRRAEDQKRKALEKQKSNLPTIPVFDMAANRQINQGGIKSKNHQPLDVPKLPPKVNPLGGLSKTPLGGPIGSPLGGIIQKSNTLLPNSSGTLPKMPVINKDSTQKNGGKKSLFDQDEQEDNFLKKKSLNIPKSSLPQQNLNKKNLFNEDDDSALNIKSKSKNTASKKKGLFDEEDDEGFGGFVKKTQKQQVKEPFRAPKIQTNSIQTKKSAPQKSNIFNNDSDDEGSMFNQKKNKFKQNQPLIKTQQQSKISLNSQQVKKQKPPNKKGLFGNSDQQVQDDFGKKKIENSKVSNTNKTTTNNFVQNQSKPINLAQKQTKTKRNIFGQSDQDQKPLKQSKIVPVKQIKSKKGLFGSSDQDDDPFKNKNQKNQEDLKSVANSIKNETTISVKKTDNSSLSPLSQPNKIQSSSSNSLIKPPSKSTNPILGSSINPISSPTQPKTSGSAQKIEPLMKNNPVQQKKRNIFEQSEEQIESNVAITKINKQKTNQQAQKKGLISQESDGAENKKILNAAIRSQQVADQKANNSRRLFDQSEQDSDEEELMKKKRMANNKLKKLF